MTAIRKPSYTSRGTSTMIRILTLPALLALSACGGVGAPSVGLDATYDQSLSRHAFDRLRVENPACHDHDHFDDCEYATQVEDHVSKPAVRAVRVYSGSVPQK